MDHAPATPAPSSSAPAGVASGDPAPPERRGSADPTAALTVAIGRGDATAFTRFYEDWYDRCIGYATDAGARHRDDAQDLVQDVMLTAARRLPRLHTEAELAAWLRRAVLTHGIDRLRADHRRARRERRAARHEADVAVDPHADAEHRERLAWLESALDRLPPADRALLAARFAGDATLAELGATLASSGNAVAGRLRRALSKLRDHAEAWFDD